MLKKTCSNNNNNNNSSSSSSSSNHNPYHRPKVRATPSELFVDLVTFIPLQRAARKPGERRRPWHKFAKNRAITVPEDVWLTYFKFGTEGFGCFWFWHFAVSCFRMSTDTPNLREVMKFVINNTRLYMFIIVYIYI